MVLAAVFDTLIDQILCYSRFFISIDKAPVVSVVAEELISLK